MIAKCPCCSDSLLRCIRKQGVYWFCPYCRQEMPNLGSLIDNKQEKEKLELLTNLTKNEKVASLVEL